MEQWSLSLNFISFIEPVARGGILKLLRSPRIEESIPPAYVRADRDNPIPPPPHTKIIQSLPNASLNFRFVTETTLSEGKVIGVLLRRNVSIMAC
jgi:hypothetical protein